MPSKCPHQSAKGWKAEGSSRVDHTRNKSQCRREEILPLVITSVEYDPLLIPRIFSEIQIYSLICNDKKKKKMRHSDRNKTCNNVDGSFLMNETSATITVQFICQHKLLSPHLKLYKMFLCT